MAEAMKKSKFMAVEITETKMDEAMKKCKFRPQGARLLVRIDEESDEPTKTQSGLIILAPAGRPVLKTKLVTGIIEAVGNGKVNKKTGERVPLDEQLQVGTRVLTNRFWGDIVELDGEEMRILGEHQVMAIVEGGDGGLISVFGEMPKAVAHAPRDDDE
jgi:co-chaperonin GroES (HSP10)